MLELNAIIIALLLLVVILFSYRLYKLTGSRHYLAVSAAYIVGCVAHLATSEPLLSIFWGK